MFKLDSPGMNVVYYAVFCHGRVTGPQESMTREALIFGVC